MTMNAETLIQASETLQREAKRYEQMTTAARVLADAGALLHKLQEAEGLLEQTRMSVTVAQAELVRLGENCEATRMEGAKIMAETEAKIMDAKAMAEKDASDALARVGREAAAMRTKARDEIDAIRQAATAERSEVTAAIAIARASLADLTEQAAAKSSELSALTAKIAEARAAIARALG